MILAYVDSGTSSFSLVHLPELALLFSFSFSLFAYKYYSNILYEIQTSNITNIINFHKFFYAKRLHQCVLVELRF